MEASMEATDGRTPQQTGGACFAWPSTRVPEVRNGRVAALSLSPDRQEALDAEGLAQ
jgi:hypothetical protein